MAVKFLWNHLLRYGTNPYLVLGVIIVVSAVSLTGALIAEHVYGLEPCILCIYQRIPFVIAIGLAVAGLLLAEYSTAGRTIPVALCGLSFAGNAVIAGHHTGVEQGWWESFSAGCAVEGISATQGANLLKQILNTPAIRCDIIPWADPVLGISMAGYNTLLCAGMTIFCGICTYLIYRSSRPAFDIRA